MNVLSMECLGRTLYKNKVQETNSNIDSVYMHVVLIIWGWYIIDGLTLVYDLNIKYIISIKIYNYIITLLVYQICCSIEN